MSCEVKRVALELDLALLGHVLGRWGRRRLPPIISKQSPQRDGYKRAWDARPKHDDACPAHSVSGSCWPSLAASQRQSAQTSNALPELRLSVSKNAMDSFACSLDCSLNLESMLQTGETACSSVL